MADMKEAMRNQDKAALETLRLIMAECRNKELSTPGSQELDDASLMAVLRKQIKQYQESIDQFEKTGRQEEATAQQKRQSVVQAYLPKPLSAEELDSLIQENIKTLKADSLKHMGVVIKAVQTQTKGAVDSAQLARLVKERLQNQ